MHEEESECNRNDDSDVDSNTHRTFCNVSMIPAKLSYFLHDGFIGSYVPFTNVFLRSLGLTVDEDGFISPKKQLVCIVALPLRGLLIDHTGRRKFIFLISCIGTIICMLSLPFVGYWLKSSSEISPDVNNTRLYYKEGLYYRDATLDYKEGLYYRDATLEYWESSFIHGDEIAKSFFAKDRVASYGIMGNF